MFFSISQDQLIDTFFNLINFSQDLWRHRYCAVPFMKSKVTAMYFALCQNMKIFPVDLHFQNILNIAKAVYVTLIISKTRSLSKILLF